MVDHRLVCLVRCCLRFLLAILTLGRFIYGIRYNVRTREGENEMDTQIEFPKEDNPILKNSEIEELFNWIYDKGNVNGEKINQLYERFLVGRRLGR